MNDTELDALLAATARVTDADVAHWDLAGPEHEMREAIMSSDRHTPAEADDPRDRPGRAASRPVPAEGGDGTADDGGNVLSLRHDTRRRRRSVAALASATAVIVVAVAGVWVRGSDDAAPTDVAGPEEDAADGPADQKRERADTIVANAVAPYNYDTGLDEVVVHNALQEPTHRYLHECVTRRGGESSYVPSPPTDRESIRQNTEVMSEDFPNFDLLAERGITPDVAVGPFRVFTDDERAMSDDCVAEPGFADAGAPYEQYSQVLFPAWMQVLRDLEYADELVEPRARFIDCIVAGGMTPDPGLNDRTFLQHAEGEMMDLPTLEEQAAHMRERGMLWAQCGRDLYAVKERLRKDAHDAFVAAHAADIARLSDYLYDNALLDPA